MSKNRFQVYKIISSSVFFFLFFCSFLQANSNFSELINENNSYAFITNQESNKLDVINIDSLAKVKEFSLGQSPAGIDIKHKTRQIFVANPNSNSISFIDLKNNVISELEAGNSPVGIKVSKNKNLVYVTNWYDNIVTVIDYKKKKIIKTINVGASPAGIEIVLKNEQIIVANRDDNDISIIDSNKLKEIKRVKVQLSPFGVFTDKQNERVFITNVKSNSVSVINTNNYKLVKNIKVGKWPYQVAFDENNKKIFVSNQRDNSISIINSQTLNVEKTLQSICEYPEGINVDNRKEIIIIACWFDDEIVILDLVNYNLLKKVSVSGGPRSFGNFVLDNVGSINEEEFK